MVKLGSACCRSPCLAAPTREWRIWSLIWVDLCKFNSWMAAGLDSVCYRSPCLSAPAREWQICMLPSLYNPPPPSVSRASPPFTPCLCRDACTSGLGHPYSKTCTGSHWMGVGHPLHSPPSSLLPHGTRSPQLCVGSRPRVAGSLPVRGALGAGHPPPFISPSPTQSPQVCVGPGPRAAGPPLV